MKSAEVRGSEHAASVLAGQPPLEKTELFYLARFDDLAADRPIVGMGDYGLLPRRTIREYGVELGFEGYQLQHFCEGVRFAELQMRRIQQTDQKRTPNK